MSRPLYQQKTSARDRRSGQILVVFVAVFAFVSAAAAMMLDGGRVYWEKRQAQNAADAAAMAGAHELRRGNDLTLTSTKAWVKQDAQRYGFGASEVSVIYPYKANNRFVGARVTRNVPMTFMRIFGRSATQVSAVAAAGIDAGPGQACVIALNNDPTQDALKVNGSMTVEANCGIMANSTDGDAMRNVGTGTMPVDLAVRAGPTSPRPTHVAG